LTSCTNLADAGNRQHDHRLGKVIPPGLNDGAVLITGGTNIASNLATAVMVELAATFN
jgi:hypothetical protein